MLTVKHFVFSPIQENTYVVYNEEKLCCIIDPGCYFGNERRELKDFIETYALTPKYLLNTHCHLDHVFGNKFVADSFGLVLHIPEKEIPVLEYAPVMGKMWDMPFDEYTGKLLFIKEGDDIHLGTDVLNVLFAPGHSPGHVCFYCEAQHFIISGDVLFRNSIGRTDLPGSDFNTLINSINTQLFVLPDDVIVYSGHGEPTSIGYEKQHNPFLNN